MSLKDDALELLPFMQNSRMFCQGVLGYEDLIEDIENSDMSLTQKTRVIQMVYYLNSQAEPYVLRFIKLKDAVLRNISAQQFFAMKMNRSNPQLVPEFARDSSANVRAQAFRYYLRTNEDISPEILDEWLVSDHQDVRMGLLRCTSKLANPAAEEYLLELMIDDDTMIRMQALRQYGSRQLSGYQKMLTFSLADENEEIQKLSAKLIFQLMGVEGRNVLINYINKNPGTPLAVYIGTFLGI